MIAPWLKRLPNSVLTLFIGISFLAFVLMLPPGKIMGYLQHGGVMLTSSWLWVTGFLYYRLRGTAKGFVLLALPSVLALTLGRFTGAPLFISIFVIVLSSEFHVPKQYLRACNFLGDYSYALYLFHIPAMIAALALGARYSITALISAFAVSLAAIYGVDYPSRKLFRYRRARSSAMMPRENA
jgi:peptidoglycan/LPS O-acetylase OafA/YrhL